MPFDFQCPHCHAVCRVDESKIGQTGPCFECGQSVLVFPPPSRVEPPRPLRSGLLAGLGTSAAFVLLMLSLRSVPMWVSMSRTGALSVENVRQELLSLLMPGLGGFFIGGLTFTAAATAVNTRHAYVLARRGILAGVLTGILVGLLIGVVLARRNPSIRFFPQGELIGYSICTSISILAAFGCGAGIPFGLARERSLIRHATFTAPGKQEASPAESVFMAEVADAGDSAPAAPPTVARPEITSERRQELIRRLGVVHTQDEDEGPESSSGSQD